MSTFKEAMNFRYACKTFKSDKIDQKDLGEILDAALLSPSSFGMQPWRITVVQTQNAKNSLRLMCWNQPQIAECSDLLIFTCENHLVHPDNDYVRERFEEKGLDKEATDKYIGVYKTFMDDKMKHEGCLEAWSAKQAYIAAANAMTCAASLKIDSCPIEGFEAEKIKDFLELSDESSVALVVALGYRNQEQSERHRLNPYDVVSFM